MPAMDWVFAMYVNEEWLNQVNKTFLDLKQIYT